MQENPADRGDKRIPALKQTVVTVHGVNSLGEWQETAASIFEPYFTPKAIKYDDYLGLLGAVQCVLSYSVLLLLGIILLIFFFISESILIFLVGLIVAFAAAIVYARFRRRYILNKFKEKLDTVRTGNLARPHVIAHSMGTYLSGTTLRKFPDVRFDRIILVGSMLACGFEWTRLLRDDSNKFREVRNEVGSQDWVAKLAGAIPILTGLGKSGILGFKSKGLAIHSLKNPLGPCQECSTSTAVIHNVKIVEFAHSEPLLGNKHIETLWLPILWGYQPHNFADFLELCWTAAYYDERDMRRELALIEAELRERAWDWTNIDGERQKFEDYITNVIWHELDYMLKQVRIELAQPEKAHMVKQTVDRAFRLIYWAITNAQRERVKTVRDDHVALALYPPTAVIRAVQAAFELPPNIDELINRSRQ